MARNDFQTVRDSFSSDSGLPFGRILTREYVLQTLKAEGHQYRSRVYCPLVTLWGWLSQCLSQDKSLNDAVARILAHGVASGLPAVSASSASYSNARQRFPESVLARMAREIGHSVHASAPPQSLWRGRRAFIADGTGLTMPDTLENQAAYPQSKISAPGLGFPLMRAVAIISLPTGAVVDFSVGKYAGKGTGESALLRSMLRTLNRGDVVIADKYYSEYFTMGLLAMRGVDVVSVIQEGRRREGEYVTWAKSPKPEWMDDETYAALPATLRLRQIDVDVENREGGTKRITVITTITDPNVAASEIADLYHQRWNCELDLRSIKCSMQMDVLRGKTPSMVRKEIWCHLLAYNLLRGVMTQSASRLDILPRHLSVKGTMQMVESFTPAMMHTGGESSLYDAFLTAISAHRVGNRPNRMEPRANKRRCKVQTYMMVPRQFLPRRLAADARSA